MVVQNLVPYCSVDYAPVPRVLVVDDDDDSLMLMGYILEQIVCETCLVVDGLAALVAARRDRPQLILSDIYLPCMDGYDLIRQLRADSLTRDIPVVAITALASQSDRDKILAAGFDDYVSKPFLIQPLEQLVRRFISLSRSVA